MPSESSISIKMIRFAATSLSYVLLVDLEDIMEEQHVPLQSRSALILRSIARISRNVEDPCIFNQVQKKKSSSGIRRHKSRQAPRFEGFS
jgi:hypothetical protein